LIGVVLLVVGRLEDGETTNNGTKTTTTKSPTIPAMAMMRCRCEFGIDDTTGGSDTGNGGLDFGMGGAFRDGVLERSTTA
jgi:hypothetical protein